MSWFTSLRAMQIRKLQETRGPWQVSRFFDPGWIEVSSSDYPGERLVVCRNPLFAEERSESFARSSGKYNRASIGLAGALRPNAANTPTGQLSTLPKRPFHWRATPADAWLGPNLNARHRMLAGETAGADV